MCRLFYFSKNLEKFRICIWYRDLLINKSVVNEPGTSSSFSLSLFIQYFFDFFYILFQLKILIITLNGLPGQMENDIIIEISMKTFYAFIEIPLLNPFS